jgi:hypothetical protein
MPGQQPPDRGLARTHQANQENIGMFIVHGAIVAKACRST